MDSWTRLRCWLGLAFAGLLLATAVWFHLSLDPIFGFLFVLVFGVPGLAMGLASLGRLLSEERHKGR